MEKRINVAELLKDCPAGMELDCVVYDNATLGKILEGDDYPIVINIGENGEYFEVTEYGTWTLNKNAKCVIFPKGKTTWEGFQRPFKDGDIVVNASNEHSNAFIYAGESNTHYESYVGLMVGTNPELLTNKCDKWVCKKSGIRFATEEEKEKLFKAIKDSGYKWNAETKTLERLVEPKFKVGNKIRPKNQHEVRLISEVWDNYYLFDEKNIPLPFSAQDDWELVSDKFDITTLKPFESRVLVRDSDVGIWLPEFFGCLCDGNDCPYMIVGGTRWKCCIPYEGNEHLLGTTDECNDFYNNWFEG